jgi:hypothetical protein
MGNGGVAPPFLTSALDGSGQLQAPAALPLGKGPPVRVVWEAGWAPEPRSGRCGVEENPCPCREWNPGRPARRYAD